MDLDSMRLRPYTVEDLPAMLSVIRTAFAEYTGKLDPPSSAEHKTIEIVRTELEGADALVAEVEGNLVGCVFFRPQHEGVYIDRLSVLPEFRKRGIASALLNEVEIEAKTAGYEALTLSVRLVLKQQQAYYNRRGFEFFEYGTHPGYAEPTYMKMKKDLRNSEG